MNRVAELEDKVQELLNLLDAFKQLNSNIEIQEVFQNILLQMVKVVKAEAGTLWILDDKKEIIKASAAYGPTKSSVLNIEMNLDEGIVGKVISTGKPHLIQDVSLDPAWTNRVDKTSGFITHSMITIPLLIKEKAIGALQLLNKLAHPFFTEEDVNLALILANQSALALKNSQMYNELYTMFMSVIQTLANVLDARDPYTAGHSQRVAMYSLFIADRLGLDSKDCEELYRAALLHDIGKIGIPDKILRKPTRLTDEEFKIIQNHTEMGAKILSNMEPKVVMRKAIYTARSHHERMNGSGYPDQLEGQDIPLFARIVGVADAFDAITTVRPYSKGLSFHEGAAELERCKNTLFDSEVVHAFISILNDYNFQLPEYEKWCSERGKRHESI